MLELGCGTSSNILKWVWQLNCFIMLLLLGTDHQVTRLIPLISWKKTLSFLDKEGKEIILLGDTNCDFAKKSTDQTPDNNTKHISSLYELFSFKQLIEEPTRVTLDTATIIDDIATTSPRNIIKSGVLEVSLSDHYMVYCIRKFNGAVEKGATLIDKDLRDLMRTRDKLKKSAVKGKSPILMDSYRKIRNKVNALNAQLKKQHYTNRISASKGNMKESWKAINELLNKRSKSSNIDCLKESGTEIRNKKDVSNTMNNFFCTIGRNLADKIQPAANPLLSGEYEVNKDKTKFNFKTIEVKDIRDAFAKVKTTMSFGNDNISSYILKLALPYTGNSLAFMFNTSIETSQFPNSWTEN